MANDELLIKDEVWLRITQLEYKMKQGMSKEAFEKEVRRIYIEEMGEELPADMKVYSSNESNNLESDYDGTAIYFEDEEKSINQLYVISQGSNDPGDWLYNAIGLFQGKDASQAIDADTFVDEAKKAFNVSDKEVLTVGLGHSLANNNNLTAQVLNESFDKVYGVNGAQINAYQLYNIDDHFYREVNQNFNLLRTDKNAIYTLPPDKLEQFAVEYIEEKIDTSSIHQLRSSNDPLYALMENTRGFVTVPVEAKEGMVTNKNYAGLSPLLANLPDEEIAKWQAIFMPAADAYMDNGVDGALDVLEEMTGLKRTVFDDFNELQADLQQLLEADTIDLSEYPVFMRGEMARSHALGQVGAKIPQAFDLLSKGLTEFYHIKQFQRNVGPIVETVQGLNDSAEEVFGYLVEAGYIDEASKDIIVKELNGLTESLEVLHDYKHLEDVYKESPYLIRDGGSGLLGSDVAFLLLLIEHGEKLYGHWQALEKELQEVMDEIGHSHSIHELLNALNAENGVSYYNNQMIVSTQHGGEEIRVNLSATVEAYYNGLSIVEQQQEKVQAFVRLYEHEVVEDVENQKKALVQAFDDMESNPKAYQHLLNKSHAPAGSRIERIVVHDQIGGITLPEGPVWEAALVEQLEKQHTFLEKMREGIEDIFDEEHNVAAIFTLSG
ncbi:hypothetical protein CAY60_003490 [Shouchella clausii]|uniref:DUF6792 domain-containing protein n=1 Tax=Shouchella TaxID=2893057 RepID=UPI0004E7A6F7|nr:MULTISPECIES: DUF6792 domain-containing protein [Shouchella]ALA52406.1 hypothetical protein DB29_01578 [Shouchella clausii]MBU3230168.1 hypothetical protein [Shouchella clausii]MBU3262633.1 hypothetical protein [Shouchella clausii]MBU3507052.1 hypothetical protein [Shouchella clausii]MBU3536677.1 hypothetical protein [Shouchella clausii]